MQPVISAIPMEFVDWQALMSSVGFAMPKDVKRGVFEFLVGELEKAGGEAVLEVEDEGIFCAWNPPTGADVDARRLVYLSHMLQAGLLLFPRSLVANTAYAGQGIALARAIVSFNELNPYVGERDAGFLVDAMPLSHQAWLAYGLVLMENLKFKLAAGALAEASLLGSGNPLTLRCLAICLTGHAPKKAVSAAEEMLGALAVLGKPPDGIDRAAYGFALLAAGMKKDAVAQFEAGFGQGLPVMTMKQWMEWGNRMPTEGLAKALRYPKASALGKKGA